MKFALTALLLLALLLSFPAASFAASPEEVKWQKVNVPADGQSGNWVLASGSDVSSLTRASDGTLYCYANPAGTSYRLFKSSDGGYSWSYTGKVEDTIVDIAAVPGKPNILYYATTSRLYKSSDAAASFSIVGLNPAGAGVNNVEITSLEVAPVESGNLIAIGTRDRDAGQFGGVYLLEESKSATWIDTHLSGYDVCTVIFSPGFATDRQIVAVATDETNTIVTACFNNTGWNSSVGDGRLNGVVASSAVIAFPADYSSEATSNKYVQFVAIETGTGGGNLFRIDGKPAPTGSNVTDLKVGSVSGLSNLDITGLAVSGAAEKATIIAGASASAEVYLSSDSGKNWTRSTKPPSGGGKTRLLMSQDFNQSGVVYSATAGAESAFSVSRDGGLTWNPTGLIDTGLTDVLDLAVSPGYDQDKTMFMLTFGGKHSVWRSTEGETKWERVCSGALTGISTIDFITLSPQPARHNTLFMAGTSSGKPALWKSINDGQSFTRFTSSDPTTGANLAIDAWVAAPDNSLFIASYDGANGVVCLSSGSAPFYSSKAIAGSVRLSSLALSPGFGEDKTLLAGSTTGWVYISEDGGTSFHTLPAGASSAPLSGSISIVFDPDYTKNKTVYAASDTPDKGIYRFVIDKSIEWESVDTSLPAGARITGLAISQDGVLYGCNSQGVDNASKKGGIERALDPNYSLGPTFETVTRGLVDGATILKLYLSGNRLWAIDSTNARLLTYVDSLAKKVALSSPADKAPGLSTRNMSLRWQTLNGATKYRWQVDRDTDFSSIPAGFEDLSEGTSAGLPALEPDTTYYWRVRAAEPVLSPWSAKWSFSTSLSTQVIAPRLTSPEAAASNVPLKPIFQWNAMSGADRYELLVATDTSFNNTAVNRVGVDALPSTAWQCDIILKYGTTYYWKVRAVSENNRSAWSSEGAFITELAPAPPVAAPAPPEASPTVILQVPFSYPQPSFLPAPAPSATTPAPPPQQGNSDNTTMLIYILIGVLLVLLVILVIVVIFMLKMFKRLN